MTVPLQLIVGLGNPGAKYAHTRHNVGAWFVHYLAEQQRLALHREAKFKGSLACLKIAAATTCWLFIPDTFMNLNGEAVRAIVNFYHIPSAAVLIAHDELDFSPGEIRLKKDGGHGGHNGLRNIIEQLHTPDFLRLRIGIGHPGDRDQVTRYVLTPPSLSEQQLITAAIARAAILMDDLVQGHWQKAVQQLHT